jgi:arginase
MLSVSGFELIGVPFDGYGRRGNQAALDAMVESVGRAAVRAVEDGRFPVVYGGDCTTLLGTIPALIRGSGPVGLTGRLLKGPLADGLGVLDKHDIAVLGPRDEAWRRRFNVGSLRDHGVWFRDWQQTSARPEENARDAVQHLRATAERWWLHVDLDVLDPAEFAAQGVPGDPDEPNGLSWDALTSVLTTAVSQGGSIGWSVAIYDPEQDPTRADAERIVRLVHDVASVVR